MNFLRFLAHIAEVLSSNHASLDASTNILSEIPCLCPVADMKHAQLPPSLPVGRLQEEHREFDQISISDHVTFLHTRFQ